MNEGINQIIFLEETLSEKGLHSQKDSGSGMHRGVAHSTSYLSQNTALDSNKLWEYGGH